MKKRLIFALVFLLIILLCLNFSFENESTSSSSVLLDSLLALPYVDYVDKDLNLTGVTVFNEELFYDGYNLFGSFDEKYHYRYAIMDMAGEVVHHFYGFEMIHMLEDGQFVGMNLKRIGKYYWNSTPIWEKEMPIHHELILSPNNTIFTCSAEMHRYKNRDVNFDVILEFDLDGNELFRWSAYENLEYLKKFHGSSELDVPSPVYDSNCSKKVGGGCYDYYHINSVQPIPSTSLSEHDQRFREGNLLISFLTFDFIAILDKDTKNIVWSWGPGEIDAQHMPRMLGNGHILIFDNGKVDNISRIIELDPVKKQIVWEYKADPPESFFTRTMGGAQRLPNGNTLITESKRGRIFEITREGKIVWEWHNPGLTKEGKKAIVYRMMRVPKEAIEPFLNRK
jgi:hypothetical protein